MILKLVFVIAIALDVFAEAEEYVIGKSGSYILEPLAPLLNPLNGLLFDGPKSISNAPTSTTNRNKLPTLERMKYFNYYCASTAFGYELANLTCKYCSFRDDLDDHTVLENNVHNTLALVTLSKKRQEIVVAFRGTNNIWNVVLDSLAMMSTPSFSRTIKLHQGFYIATMSLFDKVVRTVRKYLSENPGCTVVITGHSLGAAMARVTYYLLVTNQEFPGITYELYTYGEPRVGNKFFADFMNKQRIVTARIVNRADIVPHIPPTSILGTKLLGDYYVHPQTEFWIKGEDDQRFCSRSVYEDPSCSMSLGPLYSLIDHYVYFDVNIEFIGQPLLLAALPFGLLNPRQDLPPLPKPVDNLVGGLGSSLFGAVAPALG